MKFLVSDFEMAIFHVRLFWSPWQIASNAKNILLVIAHILLLSQKPMLQVKRYSVQALFL